MSSAVNLKLTQSESLPREDSAHPPASSADCGSGDFPRPPVLDKPVTYDWDDVAAADENYSQLGRLLGMGGDLFRQAVYAGGLMLASASPFVPPFPIKKGAELAAIIIDRVRVNVIVNGIKKGSKLSAYHLSAMLKSEVFLQQFRAVDRIVNTPMFLSDFTLTQPGYNDGGPGQRIFFVGESPDVRTESVAIEKFLDAMAFETDADRANTVAAALTRVLRNHWPGAKPIVIVTSTKSHGGKGTVVDFVAGTGGVATVDYQPTSWAMERSFVGTVKMHPEAAVINLDNTRLYRGEDYIASSFIERIVMDPEPTLFSTGTGPPLRRLNDLILAITANHGTVSTDLANRGLPIHLDPTGNVEDRTPAIGNPRYDYLPSAKEEIEPELRGMVQRWINAGMPLDESVKHPFTPWARTIGGILKTNGVTGFLDNYSVRKSVDDPVRKGIGLLGASHTDQWERPAFWAARAAELGLTKTLIPAADRDGEKARERGIGKTLSDHRDERLDVETADERMALHLRRARRRFDKQRGEPETRYRFDASNRQTLPADAEEAG